MNVLLCSAGRRCELIKDFRNTMRNSGRIIATDSSQYAPALYFTDNSYIVPPIDNKDYINVLLKICKEEKIDVVLTLIDPEIEILSKNRELFAHEGIKVMAPYYETAKLCFDKYQMYIHLKRHGIPTLTTYGSFEDFLDDYVMGAVSFPVFVKPRTGSGSVGARRIDKLNDLESALENDPQLIIQEYMVGVDCDADVYVDAVSGKVVSVFLKRKVSSIIGGANKTVSVIDEKLIDFIQNVAGVLELCGPNDMDLFYKDGQYYLTEINPRFGGAYLHAYGAGVDFIRLIENNVANRANESVFNNYDNGVVMMMYDNVIIKRQEELLGEEDTCHRK